MQNKYWLWLVAAAVALLVAVVVFAAPVRAQTVPPVAQCNAQKSAAIAFYRKWFAVRTGRTDLSPGPDDAIWADPGVVVMACLIAAGPVAAPDNTELNKLRTAVANAKHALEGL